MYILFTVLFHSIANVAILAKAKLSVFRASGHIESGFESAHVATLCGCFETLFSMRSLFCFLAQALRSS